MDTGRGERLTRGKVLAARSVSEIQTLVAQAEAAMDALVRDDQLRHGQAAYEDVLPQAILSAASDRTARILKAADAITRKGLNPR
ncbi:hypothetical protein SPF06_19665 [Sinomonas sp. JGH33]|uniref:Uncharacterized protein n=1 Tax=Sinomonas terricola TaxID=3110330 RepID=A0ABU5TB82_9MICC|nr:hypothetical protein [Sinomonas sp. JGH33]MEA5456946.1 hypothetical protein [Sinomonas sp. JGH33]